MDRYECVCMCVCVCAYIALSVVFGLHTYIDGGGDERVNEIER